MIPAKEQPAEVARFGIFVMDVGATLRDLLNCKLLPTGIKVWHRADCSDAGRVASP